MTAGITLTTTAAVAAGAAVAGTITRITPPSPTTLPFFESSPPPPASLPPAPAAAANEESIKRVHEADSNRNTDVHANNHHADKNNQGQVLLEGLDKEETGTTAVVSVAGAANAADSLSLALEASSPPAAKRIKLEPTTPSVVTTPTATVASHPAPHANDNDAEGEDTDGDDSEYEDCEEEQEEEQQQPQQQQQQQQHDEEVVTGVAEEFDEMYSAKMADETVKALGLPDTEALI